jgi:hypothetical protein
MENWNIKKENGLDIIEFAPRDFKMSVIKNRVINEGENQKLLYVVVAEWNSADEYVFEVLNPENDPDFTKWDNKLFIDAIDLFCDSIIGMENKIISFPNAEALYP